MACRTCASPSIMHTSRIPLSSIPPPCDCIISTFLRACTVARRFSACSHVMCVPDPTSVYTHVPAMHSTTMRASSLSKMTSAMAICGKNHHKKNERIHKICHIDPLLHMFCNGKFFRNSIFQPPRHLISDREKPLQDIRIQ